jgi:hypothetical protein
MLQSALNAAAAPTSRRGRPPGTLAPLTRWLRGLIKKMRRDGFGQIETWRRLCLHEDAADDGRSFTVSEETADECWDYVGADLAGERVSWAAFRSAWWRANK